MRLRDIITSIRVGARVQTLNDGKMVKEVIIRYKDKYVVVDEDAETGEIVSLGWMASPMGHVPLREYWQATPPVSDLADEGRKPSNVSESAP